MERAEASGRPPSRGRRALFAVVSLLLGIVAALAAGEILMRLGGVRPERYAPRRFEVLRGGRFQPCGGWRSCGIYRPSPLASQGLVMGEFVPGSIFRMIYASDPRGYLDPEHVLTYRINSRGMRGPEFAPEKPAGTYRILGIGDSFAFGTGVREKDTFLRRLERSLNEGAAGASRYEVLNAGTPGYNTRDEMLSLEHRWLGLEPDLVLIVFYLNDAYSDRAFLNRGQELGIYLNQPGGVARYSYLADYVQHIVRARKARREVEEYYRRHYFARADRFLSGSEAATVDWGVSRAALARAVDLADRHGFELALAIFPEFYRLDGDYPFEEIHGLVMRTCGALGIPALDLLETFRGRAPRDLWVHPQDHHPNETAHGMAARSVERFLRDQRLAGE